MLDYQLNRGCLSDLFDLNSRSGLLCSCPAEMQGQYPPASSEFTLLKSPVPTALVSIYGIAKTGLPATIAPSPSDDAIPSALPALLDLDTHAVFLPLVQPVLLQRFAQKLIPESDPIILRAQTRPDTAILPPRAGGL